MTTDEQQIRRDVINAVRKRLRAQGFRGYPDLTPEETPYLFDNTGDN